MSEEGRIYLAKNRKVGEFHHSSFLAGRPISAGGEIVIEKGIIKIINNESGHYRPSIELVEKNILNELSKRHYFGFKNRKEQIEFLSGF